MEKDLNNLKYIHFIGIGGSGMSGLARIMKAQNKAVTGSDQHKNHTIESLIHEGIKIKIGQKIQQIPNKTQAVVYSPAVPQNNPEMKAARKMKIHQFSYPEAVGRLTRTKSTICICGTHGKTTTTAMSSAAFLKGEKDPSIIVGAAIKELNNHNARHGMGENLIIESCEYRRGFLNYQPQTIVITNIEADHLDYYKNLADYKKAFLQFVHKLPQNGMVIANHDDKNIRSILKNYRKTKIIWYGQTAGAEYVLKNNVIYHKKMKQAELTLQVPGNHNLMNATAVVALAGQYKIPIKTTIKALNEFKGSSRRFETVGYHGKAIVIDDYGHHPTEIKATLSAARERFGAKAKILCIFQPHQYSRTYKLLKDFVKAFKDASEIIIPNIYGVRDSEQDMKKIDTNKFVLAISKHHKHVINGKGFEKTINRIRKDNSYDVILTMGAGDVYKISEQLVEQK